MRRRMASGEEDTVFKRGILQREALCRYVVCWSPCSPYLSWRAGMSGPRLPRPVHAGANICSRRMHCPNAVLGMFASKF